MLAGEKPAQLGHVAVEEQWRPADLLDEGEGVFRLQRDGPHDQGELGVEELEVAGGDVARVDEDRRERPRHAVDVVAGARRPDRAEDRGRLLLADLGRVAKPDLVLRRGPVAVGGAEVHVEPAVAGLVPPRQPGAAHRQRLAAVEGVVAGVVGVGAERADRPRRQFILGVAVGHDSHVAGRGEGVDERPLHERVVAVLCHPLQREGLEVVASADVLQPGQLLPLQVVVEVAGLVGEGEVDPQRVFEDLEAGAPGADAEPAKLGAILEITDARPADGPLAEVDLVGLHLAGDDERRLLGVVGLLFVAGGDEFSQPLLDGRDPFLCGAPGLLLASFCPACFLRAALLLAARGRDGAGRRSPGRRSLLGRPQVVDLPLQAFQFAGHA